MLESESAINRSANFLHSKRKQRLFQAVIASECALLVVFLIFFAMGNANIMVSTAGSAILISSIFLLIKRDKVELGIQLFLIIISFIMLCFMWLYEGTKDEVVLVYPAIITFALVLGNIRLGFGLILFIIGNILLLGFVNSAGIYVNNTGGSDIISAVVSVILISLVSYTIWLISSDIRELLDKITTENKRVEASKERIQSLLDNEKRLREQEIEVHNLKNLENIGLLAGGIAHDFNNMLTAILGNISLAKLKLGDDHPSVAYLKNSEKSIDRATQLASQLLTFAKGGAPKKEVLDLFPLIKETVQFDLTGSHVNAEFMRDCDTTMVEVDKGQIQQVISNITINALQAMASGGTYRIRLTDAEEGEILNHQLTPGDYIKIQFSDEGTGMDPATLAKIFDLYFTTKGSGNGLGMTIVHSIIKKHKGAIDIHSKVNEGTRVDIFLPRSASETQVIKEDNQEQLPSQYDLSILILDDDAGILEMVSAMFEEKGAQVATARDGQALINRYRQSYEAGHPYRVVIFDLTIPGGMGGKEAVQGIKAIDPDALCIVSSGYADDPVMANYTDYGFQAAVSKPYHLEELYLVVADLVGINRS